MLLRAKISVGYTAVAVLMACISVIATIKGYNRIINEHAEITSKYYRTTSIAQELSYRTSQNQAGIWGFLVTGKTRYLVTYDENMLPLKSLIKEGREIHRDNQKYLDLINTYERLLAQWQEGVAEPQKALRRLFDYGSISNEQYGTLLANTEQNGSLMIKDLKAISEQMLRTAEEDMARKAESAVRVARYTKVFLLAVSLMAVAAISTIGVFISDHITSALYRVVGAAKKIATGDFSHRIPLSEEKDELRELTHAFNHMAQSLQDNIGALQESENKYATLVENAADGIAIVQDEAYVAVNRAFLEMTGYGPDDLVGMDFRSFLSPHSADIVEDRLTKRLKGKEVPAIYEVEIRNKSGHLRLLETNSKLITYRQRPAVLVVFRDITDKRDYERNLKRLSERLIQTQEEERKRISSELHDGVGQALSLINVNAVLLEEEERFVPESTREKIGRVRQLVEKCLEDIHRISYNLRPCLLDDFGLVSAIRWHTKTFEKSTGIRVNLSVNEDIHLASKTWETLIYRVIQEALTNVLKHAKASSVIVSLKRDNSSVDLYIEDNGIGFDGGRNSDGFGSEKGGLGIFGMRERLAVLNGWLRVDSKAGTGTRVSVHIPLDTEAQGGVEDGKD